MDDAAADRERALISCGGDSEKAQAHLEMIREARSRNPYACTKEAPVKTTAISTVPQSAPVHTTTPADLLQIAVSQDADLDKLERLMGLQLQWESNEAKKAYNAALAAFKAECPPVLDKDTEVNFDTGRGRTRYKHATLGGICDVVVPILSKYGLSHDWSCSQSERGQVSVTCHIRHKAGHSESVTLYGPHDASGSKNAIQQIGSTISYLQRYSLQAALGLSTKEQDDDGIASGPRPHERAPTPQVSERDRLLDEVKATMESLWPDAGDRKEAGKLAFGFVVSGKTLAKVDNARLQAGIAKLRELHAAQLEPAAIADEEPPAPVLDTDRYADYVMGRRREP